MGLELLSLSLWVAVVLMGGEVLDAVSRAPVAGASITVVGTTAPAVLTDSAGRFRLEVAEGSRLRITRAGYAPLDLTARGDTGMRLLLTPLTRALE
ncbi:MAG: carboxypeptidase regulatory-like domain-containing protein, partial [Gemmatimonadaceae bacterium]